MKYFIYFLIRGGRVVYIGQTQHPRSRISNHKSDKEFDSHRLIECAFDKLNHYESRWINRFKPEYNKNAPYVPVNRKIHTMNKEKSMRLFMSAEQFSFIDNRSQSLGISKTEYILSLIPIETLILEDCKK